MGAMTGRPWEKNSIHPQNDLFDKYLEITPWSNYEKVAVKREFVFTFQRYLYRTLPSGLYAYFHKLGQNRYLRSKDREVRN
jgi:hypothetical protein